MSTPGTTAPIQKYKSLAHRMSLVYAHSRVVGIFCLFSIIAIIMFELRQIVLMRYSTKLQAYFIYGITKISNGNLIIILFL